MLEVLDSAQAAGQKTQQDAEIGQGSIFDLGRLRRRRRRRASAFAAPSHPPIPTHEFERPELLAMEKESIGVFITEHPLKRVREALRMKADCAIAEIAERKDGEWVKVGGMITEAKKIRTRSGTTMMFATVDDLEGTVEVVVFEKALAAAEGVLATDEIVLVRGRVDHKDANKVCIVVQDVDALRAVRGRDREGQGHDRRAGRARGSRGGCACASTPPAWRRRSSPSCATCSSAIRARTTSCSRCRPAPACAACASAASTGSPRRNGALKSELRAPARRRRSSPSDGEPVVAALEPGRGLTLLAVRRRPPESVVDQSRTGSA